MDEQRIHINILEVQRYASYLRNTARTINQKQESLISEVGRVSQYWRDDDYQRFRSDILPIIRELATFQRECIAEAMRLEEIARAATQVRWGKGLSRIALGNSVGNLERTANQQEGDSSGREYTTKVLERSVSTSSTGDVFHVSNDKVLGSLKRDDGLKLKEQIEGGLPRGYDAHHLIGINESKDSIALQKAVESGYNINHGHNGIALPTTVEESEKTGLPLHSGRHLANYTTHVSQWLEILDEEFIRAQENGKPWSSAQILNRIYLIEEAIRNEITSHKISLQNNDPNKNF